MIRKARIEDVRTIHKMLEFYSRRNELLARSLSELYDNMRDFFIYADGVPEIWPRSALCVYWKSIRVKA